MSEVCKKIVSDKAETRRSILEALDNIVPIVSRTLGPSGLPILLQRENLSPHVTKDGVTVSESIRLADQRVNTVIQTIKEASAETGKQVGDGTTTVLCLVDSIVREGFKLIEMGVINPQELSAQLYTKADEVIELLKDLVHPVETEQQQHFISMISSNGDKEVSDKVVEAISRAGRDGVTILQEGGSEIELDHIEGYQFESTGFHKFGTPGINFITNEVKQMGMCASPAIICYNGELNDVMDVAQFLRAYTNDAKDVPSGIIFCAHEFSGQVLQYVLDSRKIGIPFFLVKTPIEGSPISSRPLILKDLSVFLGCDIIEGRDKALTHATEVENYKERFTGECDRFEIERYKTTFFSGHGSDEYKNEYIKILKAQLLDCKSEWDGDVIKRRIGKLTGGIVLVYVGGRTPVEMLERKDRVEDSLNAVRAGIQEGILPGGGCALLYASKFLGEDVISTLFKKALRYPINCILSNAGAPKEIILDKIDKKFEDGEKLFGYDVSKKCFLNNMIEGGIIDPFKVTKSALYNAVSIAAQMLVCGGIVYFDDYVTNKKDTAMIQQ